MKIAVLCAAALSLACISAASAGDARVEAKPPFRITWTKGRCTNCRFARKISGMAFARGRWMWGWGYLPPGRVAGDGEWTILHSLDGGRTWREVPHSLSHNIPIIISFSTPDDGWIVFPNPTDTLEPAVPAASFTSDGGAHWHRLPLPAFFVDKLTYLGGDGGFASELDPNSKASRLYFTRDRGRSWRGTDLPRGFDVERMEFWDSRNFLLAGCEGRSVIVLSTANAGQSWSRTTLQLPSTTGAADLCDGSVDGLTLSRDGTAFLLVRKANFGIDDTQDYYGLWKTIDRGRSWKRIYWSESTQPVGQFTFFNGPYRLGKMMVIFEDTLKGGYAVVSRDGGKSWLQAPLPRRLADCVEAPDRLICATHSFTLATLRPS